MFSSSFKIFLPESLFLRTFFGYACALLTLSGLKL